MMISFQPEEKFVNINGLRLHTWTGETRKDTLPIRQVGNLTGKWRFIKFGDFKDRYATGSISILCHI
jgi:hypothetical protein